MRLILICSAFLLLPSWGNAKPRRRRRSPSTSTSTSTTTSTSTKTSTASSDDGLDWDWRDWRDWRDDWRSRWGNDELDSSDLDMSMESGSRRRLRSSLGSNTETSTEISTETSQATTTNRLLDQEQQVSMTELNALDFCSSTVFDQQHESTNPLIAEENYYPVCIIGNAETHADARRSYRSWYGFPAVYSIWGKDFVESGEDYHDDSDLLSCDGLFCTLKCYDQSCSWAEGLKFAYHATKLWMHETGSTCEYIMTVDDDSIYMLNEDISESSSVQQELVRLLNLYQPMVVNFPWKMALENFDMNKEMEKKGSENAVTSLVAGDNGNFLFNHRVADFFIPYSPDGEGGFVGEWTLPAIFLNFFIPLIFREQAITIHSITYENSKQIMGKALSFEVDSNGTKTAAVHEGSRHPYEYPMKAAYKSFLEEGRFGFTWFDDGNLVDRNWPIYPAQCSTLSPCDRDIWNVDLVYHRLHRFYNTSYPSFPRQRGSDLALGGLAPPAKAPFRYKIILFTQWRFESFNRAIRSISESHFMGFQVDLLVHVDAVDDPQHEEGQLRILKFMDGFEWKHGELKVVQPARRKGLKASILEAWEAEDDRELAIFVEDDVELSPFWFHWVENAVHTYFTEAGRNDIFSLSLFRPRFNELVPTKSTLDVEGAYAQQTVHSWGFVAMPNHWREFKSWAASRRPGDVNIPGLSLNRWPDEKSWKKAALRFVVERGLVSIYPGCTDFTLAYNHMSIGENNKGAGASSTEAVMKFNYPLLSESSVPDVAKLLQPPPSLPTFDIYDRPVVGRLHEINLNSFDRVTIIMPTYKRPDTAKDQVNRYRCMSVVGLVIVKWNDIDSEPPAFPSIHNCSDVIVVKMENNINNRFIPMRQISTQAVFTLDDDVVMSEERVTFAFRTWQLEPHRLVGFRKTSRGYLCENQNSKEDTDAGHCIYQRVPPTGTCPECLQEKGINMALTGASIFHAKYLHTYFSDMPDVKSARLHVESIFNCEDILMNVIIAQATRRGPVIVDDDIDKVALARNEERQGLYVRTQHFEERDQCVAKFQSLLGGLYPASGYKNNWQDFPIPDL